MEILQNEYLLLIVWLFTLVWGISYGVKNWTVRVVSLFSIEQYNQSAAGKVLDAVWIVCVGFLVYTYN